MTSSDRPAQYPTPAPVVTSWMTPEGEDCSVAFQRLCRLASYWNALSAHMDYPPRLTAPGAPVTALVMVEQYTHYEPRLFQWNPQRDTWQQSHPNYGGDDDKPTSTPHGWDAVDTDTPQ